MSAALSLKDIQILCNEVRRLTEAKLPLEHHLASAAGGQRRLQQLTESITESLNSGMPLGDVIQKHSVGDTRMLAGAVAAGIRCGRLNATVEMMGDLAGDLVKIRGDILRSLTYPVIILLVALVLFTTIIQSALVRLLGMFRSYDVPSPFLEWNASHSEWPLYLLAVLLGMGMLWVISGRAASMAFRGPEAILLLIPGVGAMIRDLRFYTLTRFLSLLVDRRIPLPEALRLSGASTGTRRLDQACATFAQAVEQGQRLPQPSSWRRSKQLPPMLHAALTQGLENEQQLVYRTQSVAAFYEDRIQNTALWLRMLMPTVTFVIIGGGAVCCYALAVFLPVIDLYRNLATGN
ncbi:MAG: type II secretion system F family protein [Planctomycetaceae bacterium]|nr:type II secretion system F family protein [Planctomycetaceae bacterium]